MSTGQNHQRRRQLNQLENSDNNSDVFSKQFSYSEGEAEFEYDFGLMEDSRRKEP